MKANLIITLIIICRINSYTQIRDTIKLINPSFEDTPRCCKPPFGWIDCGFKGETPPDVQPAIDKEGQPLFNVIQEPIDGETYLGMVVRENESYERVAQKLNIPLVKGKCYSFSIMLCRSNTYLSLRPSVTNNPDKLIQYTDPIILRIWGCQSFCIQNQLLDESQLIENTNWQKYDFQFKAKSEFPILELEAFYKTPVLFPYNGNVLLDDASDIIEIDCNSMDKD